MPAVTHQALSVDGRAQLTVRLLTVHLLVINSDLRSAGHFRGPGFSCVWYEICMFVAGRAMFADRCRFVINID